MRECMTEGFIVFPFLRAPSLCGSLEGGVRRGSGEAQVVSDPDFQKRVSWSQRHFLGQFQLSFCSHNSLYLI